MDFRYSGHWTVFRLLYEVEPSKMTATCEVLSLHENDNLGSPGGKESDFEGEKTCGYLPVGRSNRLLQGDC